MARIRSRSEPVFSVPAVTVSGPLDLAKGETKRFKGSIKIPANIQLRAPLAHRVSGNSYSGSNRNTPFSRNHRRRASYRWIKPRRPAADSRAALKRF